MAKKKDEQPIIIIRKKSGHAAHHGGAWKVAFADFMTAMFALFLVLWLVNQSSDVKSAIAGYFQDPLGRADEFGSSIMPGEGAQSQTVRKVIMTEDIMNIRINKVQNAAKKLTDLLVSDEMADIGDHIQIKITDEGLEIELIEDEGGFLFEQGSPSPSPFGKSVLARLAPEIAALGMDMRIEGHTDGRPYRADGRTNWELSADRANAARQILTDSGVPFERLMEIRAMADKDLKVPEDPLSAQNRRVTLALLLPEGWTGEEDK